MVRKKQTKITEENKLNIFLETFLIQDLQQWDRIFNIMKKKQVEIAQLQE
jgi:hypothetical protein